MKARTSKKNLTFEERMARLQEIVEALENGQPSLEEGMALYQEGMECSLQCRRQLEQARQQLTQLPREKYVHLLVQLAVKNGAGTEEIILSPEDAPLGQQVLEGANAQGRHFRLSAEQRPTGGGLILKQGSVECSCTFPEILRQLRQEMSGEVAAILFD